MEFEIAVMEGAKTRLIEFNNVHFPKWSRTQAQFAM